MSSQTVHSSSSQSAGGLTSIMSVAGTQQNSWMNHLKYLPHMLLLDDTQACTISWPRGSCRTAIVPAHGGVADACCTSLQRASFIA